MKLHDDPNVPLADRIGIGCFLHGFHFILALVLIPAACLLALGLVSRLYMWTVQQVPGWILPLVMSPLFWILMLLAAIAWGVIGPRCWARRENRWD